ncbi:MAG: hypothetical protein RMJ98_02205 [Myxococcales bacterium]|nr:hypothetical protein [Polyangiaceae bacterium]MDW8248102.1 hypothetical protein [Myxococcales bacterium]
MSTTRVKESRWTRHLEGWPGGLVALGLAGLGVALGTPRAVFPRDFPLPVANGRRLEEIARQDQLLAEELAQSPEDQRSGASFELRELGALLRRYNEADATGDQGTLGQLRPELLRGAYNLLLKEGVVPLLRLRAYQQRSFLRELALWESTGKESDELKQIGGGIIRTITASGWIWSPRSFAADSAVRAALFKRRFAEVLGLQKKLEFALDIDEARALYAFLLAHPPPQPGGPSVFRLKKLEELAAADPAYPRKLARGVALLGMGQGAAAVVEFREYLAETPDGPYTLRARNYLAAAVEQAERHGAMP